MSRVGFKAAVEEACTTEAAAAYDNPAPTSPEANTALQPEQLDPLVTHADRQREAAWM